MLHRWGRAAQPRHSLNNPQKTSNYGVMTADDFYTSLQGIKLPPVERWNPDRCGDSHMCIAADGTWFHEGVRIARPELVRLFAGLLRKEGKDYVLVTPAEKLSILVEDVPFQAVQLEAEGEGAAQRLTFVTNVGDRVPLQTLRMTGGVPYIDVRQGLEARIARNVYYRLADMAVPHGGQLGVWSGGQFFALGSA